MGKMKFHLHFTFQRYFTLIQFLFYEQGNSQINVHANVLFSKDIFLPKVHFDVQWLTSCLFEC